MKFISNKWSFKFHLHFICSSHAILNFHLKMVFSDFLPLCSQPCWTPLGICTEIYFQQDCIPVGCIPPACWLYLPAFTVLGGCLVPGGLPQGVWYPSMQWDRIPPPHPLWTKFLTHATENITLPQTSFAGGNDRLHNQGHWIGTPNICRQLPVMIGQSPWQ